MCLNKNSTSCFDLVSVTDFQEFFLILGRKFDSISKSSLSPGASCTVCHRLTKQGCGSLTKKCVVYVKDNLFCDDCVSHFVSGPKRKDES